MFDDLELVHVYLPPGWPSLVRPPGSEDWRLSATAYLLDCCPPEYRSYPVLLKYPEVLARFAREFTEASLDATKRNLGGLRTWFSKELPPQVISAAVAALHSEQARLMRVRRACELVEAALRDVTFKPKL